MTKSIFDLQKEFAIEAVAQPDEKDLIIKALQDEVFTLQLRVQELNEQNRKAQGLVNVSAAEIICLEQLDILGSKSAVRELSLDETKRLDLLVKNLKLVRETANDAIDIPNLEKIGEDNLVAIARGEA